MVSPYRPLHAAKPEPEEDPEERVLAVLLIVLGLARVVPAIATGETFGTEATIASLMLACGVAMVVPMHRVLGWCRLRE